MVDLARYLTRDGLKLSDYILVGERMLVCIVNEYGSVMAQVVEDDELARERKRFLREHGAPVYPSAKEFLRLNVIAHDPERHLTKDGLKVSDHVLVGFPFRTCVYRGSPPAMPVMLVFESNLMACACIHFLRDHGAPEYRTVDDYRARLVE